MLRPTGVRAQLEARPRSVACDDLGASPALVLRASVRIATLIFVKIQI